MPQSKLARNIKSLRKQKGWSQEQLGESLNRSRSTISKWETGAEMPDAETTKQISLIFGVSIDYLLGQHQSQTSYINEFNRLYNLDEEDEKLLEIVDFLQHAPNFKELIHTYTTLPKHQQEHIEQLLELLVKFKR